MPKVLPVALATELAAHRLEVDTVVTPHAPATVRPDVDDQPEMRRLTLRHAERLVALNTAQATRATRLAGSRAQIGVMPCGVDVGRHTPNGAATTPRRRAAHRLVYFASEGAGDGSATAIEAFALHRRR